MPQAVDAGIIRRMAELLMEAAELAVTIATESVEPTLVARVVDVGGDAGGAFGCGQRVVVGGGVRLDEHLFRHSTTLWSHPNAPPASPPTSTTRATRVGSTLSVAIVTASSAASMSISAIRLIIPASTA